MEKKEFEFPKKTIRLKPIHRQGGWLPKGHDAAFMVSGSSAWYPVPVDPHGNLMLNASDEELRAIEKGMSVESGYLNPNKPDKDNYWKNFKTRIKMTREGMSINLSNPKEYIYYIIARSNSDTIAPSWEERLNKATYKFAIVDIEDEIKTKASEADITKDVWIAYGAIANSSVKMANALKLMLISDNSSVKVAKSASEDFLKAELKKFAENKPKIFLKIVNDQDFTLKADILSAVDVKAITKDGYKYYITGNPDAKMTFDSLVEYLKNPENQDILLELKDRLKS